MGHTGTKRLSVLAAIGASVVFALYDGWREHFHCAKQDLGRLIRSDAAPRSKLDAQRTDLLVVWAWRVRTGDGKVDRGIASGVAWVHSPK
jgi:hypothetical protein